MKKVYHDYKVDTDEDPLITTEFAYTELRSLGVVRKALARRLGVEAERVKLEKVDQLCEPPDTDGYGLDTYDVIVDGKIRDSVWVTDDFVLSATKRRS